MNKPDVWWVQPAGISHRKLDAYHSGTEFNQPEKHVYRNKKTGKYCALVSYPPDKTYKDVSNVEEATKIDELTIYFNFPYGSKLYTVVPYEQELRKQKLKKLNKNWFIRIVENIKNVKKGRYYNCKRRYN